jgi:hypothetical protein
MVLGRPEEIAPEVVIHRVGGGSAANRQLSPVDRKQTLFDLPTTRKVTWGLFPIARQASVELTMLRDGPQIPVLIRDFLLGINQPAG